MLTDTTQQTCTILEVWRDKLDPMPTSIDVAWDAKWAKDFNSVRPPSADLAMPFTYPGESPWSYSRSFPLSHYRPWPLYISIKPRDNARRHPINEPAVSPTVPCPASRRCFRSMPFQKCCANTPNRRPKPLLMPRPY